jgi:4-amino-4-deoxy-L-arabinose transferase-like glycosyltransferase
MSPVVIVAAALIVRLIYPGVFIFKEDEARSLIYALEVARNHTFLTHTWPSSIGIANSPLFVYLLAPFTRLSSSPPFMSLVMSLMNLASVTVVYLIFKLIFQDKREVRLTVLFYALAPLAVHYSRKIWDPVPLPLICALAVYAALRVLATGRSKSIFPLVLLLAIAAQIHQSGIFFALLLSAAVALQRPRVDYRWLAAGLIAGAASAVPYLLYLAGGGIAEIANSQRQFLTAPPDIDVVTNFILNLTGHNLFAAAGRDAVMFLNWPIPGFGALTGVLLLLFLPVLFHGTLELRSRSTLRLTRRPPFVTAGSAAYYNVLLICILGLPILYLLFRVPGVAHYYLVVFPLIFSLIPLGMTRIGRLYPAGRLQSTFPFLPLLWFVLTLCFLSMTAYRHGGSSYGPVYAFQREIGREVLERAERDRHHSSAGTAVIGTAQETPDEIAVAIYAPKMSSTLPPQWEYLFRNEFAREPVSSGSDPYYRVTLEWSGGFWRRGTYVIEKIDPGVPR